MFALFKRNTADIQAKEELKMKQEEYIQLGLN